MGYVYVLQEQVTKRYYVGSCVDLNIRLKRHCAGTASATTRSGVWELVLYKRYESIEFARIGERKIKSYKGGNGFKLLFDNVEWSKALHPATAGRAA